ncbi:MAG: anthranilate synthase component I family protein, partial [Acidobacteriota bacterium]
REFERLAREHRRVPVVLELTADTVTPTGMLLRLARHGRHPFLLESIEGGERVARWSFAGCDPAEVVTMRRGRVEIDGAPVDGAPVEELRARLVGSGRAALEDLPPFAGGAVGWLGYDVVRVLERLPARLPDPLDLPEAWFGIYATVAALDRVRQRLLLVTVADAGAGVDAAWTGALGRLDRLRAALAAPLDLAGPTALPVADAAGEPDGSWLVAPEDERFLRAVTRARDEIRAGEAFQIVLSRRWSRRVAADPITIYRALRLTNPSPYMFYLDGGDAQILGASPEKLAHLRGREAVTCPIAGTRRRGRGAADDQRLAAELLADEKERAEHLMLVDLGRNDIGRVAAPGSVRVTRFMEVERYSHVMHLVSEVRGEIEHGRDALDVLLACFPAGTLTGAPKVRAMELIEELEALRRSVYGGAVGYFDFSGDMDACIAIRTAVAARGALHLQAGAGVVFDSAAEREMAECANKVRALALAARLAEGMQP